MGFGESSSSGNCSCRHFHSAVYTAAKRASAVRLFEVQDAVVMNVAASATVKTAFKNAGADRGRNECMHGFYPRADPLAGCLPAARSYTIYDVGLNLGEVSSMSAALPCDWTGVYPAATTQFDPELAVDLPATQRVQKALLQDGVHGLVLMGTVGEGNSLGATEKLAVLKGAVEVAEGRVPVIAGVSELTTAAVVAFARDAERIGAAGLMLLPAMVYVPTPAE